MQLKQLGRKYPSYVARSFITTFSRIFFSPLEGGCNAGLVLCDIGDSSDQQVLYVLLGRSQLGFGDVVPPQQTPYQGFSALKSMSPWPTSPFHYGN